MSNNQTREPIERSADDPISQMNLIAAGVQQPKAQAAIPKVAIEDLTGTSDERFADRESIRTEIARIRGMKDRGRLGLYQNMTVGDYGGQLRGYHLRWVNDQKDRLNRYMKAGWSHVLNDSAMTVGQGNEQKNLSAYVSTDVQTFQGIKTRAYLMRIPEEIYREDELEYLEGVAEVERQIMGRKYVDKLGFHPAHKTRQYDPRDKKIHPAAQNIPARPDGHSFDITINDDAGYESEATALHSR